MTPGDPMDEARTLPDACLGCAGSVQGLDRRAFLGRGALAAAALLLAGCSTGGGGGSPTLSGSFTVNVASYPALATVGGVALVTSSGGYPVAVVRTSSGYLALSRICPHQGATVGTSGSGFRCPQHGATFAIDGTWTGGERTSSMRQLASSFDASTGILTIG